MATSPRVVAYYERWSGKLAFHGWHPSVQATPIIADKPSGSRHAIPQPYLFKEFRRQPWLGWRPNADEPVSRKDPHTPFVAIRPWVRWQPQPWLGWNAAQDTGADVTPPFVPVRAWKGWLPQPWLGWNQSGDVPPLTPTSSDTPFSAFVVAYYERWSARFAWLGWNPAQDLPPIEEGGAEQLLLLWERAWTLQPWLGWNPNPETGVAPLVDTPPPPVLHPYLFLPYRRQPSLGWVQAVDVPPIIAPPTARPKHMPMFIRRIELYNQRNW